ncbi:MAG: MFS transporter [Opitutaceae bacterium]|nr:MFS transporter [Opitutaceae bacterium]
MTSSIRNRLFFMMVLEIAIWGAWQIKIFPYMGMLGFTAGQQAWVGSVFGIASLIGMFFSNQFADRSFSAERFLAFSHLVGGIALIATSFAQTFPTFFALFLVYGLLYVPTISVANSLAFANLKDPAKDFGFVRMGGTVGWIVVSWPFIFLLGDKADASETRWVFIVAGALSLVLAAYSLTLPHTPPRKDAEGLDRFAWLRAAKLLRMPFVAILFLVTFLDAVIHNGYFVVIDSFLTHVGISAKMTMVVSSIGQVAEIVTMLALGAVLKRLGWKWTMIIGILGHAVRYGVFSLFADSGATWLIVAVQVLHGICYAFFFATVYIFVDAVFPKDVRSSAQGGANFIILGLGMVVASQLFPRLVAAFSSATGAIDYHKLFLVPTAVAIAGILLLLFFFHPPTRAPGEVGASSAPH